MRKRIIIVDDHEVVRLGLKSLLERSSRFEVVAEAQNAKEAVEQVQAHQPEIVLMDIRLPGASGISACQEIKEKYPDIDYWVKLAFKVLRIAKKLNEK